MVADVHSVIVHPLSSLTSDEIARLIDDILDDPRVGAVDLFDTSPGRAAGSARTGGDLTERVDRHRDRHGQPRREPPRRKDLE